MKDVPTGKISRTKTGTDTDWNRLRRMSVAEIRTGIEADLDAHLTVQLSGRT